MKLSFFISALIFMCSNVTAQTPNNPFQNLVTVATNTPDAASIEKFGNIPISYSTGTASVSVPIYTIEVGGIKIPLSLDYHSSGIRVDEVSSSVGIGWALNGIGLVSRHMVGIPDEIGYMVSQDFNTVYNSWVSGGAGYSASTNDAVYQYLVNCQNGVSESEPDIYSYTIDGQSGKFIFKKDNSIYQIPKSNNIITYNGNFTIKDANGAVYIFNQPESMLIPSGSSSSINFNSTWRLTKIIAPNGVDEINFIYDNTCSSNTEKFANFSRQFGSGPDCSTGGTIEYAQGIQVSYSTQVHWEEYFPREINWRGGKVLFTNTCDRTDKASEKRLNQIDVYSVLNGNGSLVKTVKLTQSYFYSNVGTIGYTATDERNYRLRLDQVDIIPVNSTAQTETYKFTYNNDPIAPRQSLAQDRWGFNNGAFGNSTGMPHQEVLWHDVYYFLGDDDREVNPTAMQACMLTSVQYPTGGKSVFELEPHQYPSTQTYYEHKSPSAEQIGYASTPPYADVYPNASYTNYRISYYFSSFNYPTQMDGVRPNIQLIDVDANNTVTYSANIDPSQSYTSPVTPWYPIYGHHYKIVVNLHTNSSATSAINARMVIQYEIPHLNEPVVGVGGGLRVKSVTKYNTNGAFISKEIYKYGGTEDGQGSLLTPETYTLLNSESIKYQCGRAETSDGTILGGCQYLTNGGIYSNQGITYHQNAVYPATQLSGSPVVYNAVTKYQVDANGNATNGKSVYTFGVIDDQPAYASADYDRVGVLLITNDWQNGFPSGEYDYKFNPSTNDYSLIHQKVYNYTKQRGESYNSLKIKSMYNWNTSQCRIDNMASATNEFLVVPIPVNTGAMLLNSVTETTFDENGNSLATANSYSYSDVTHLYPTAKQITNSKGQTVLDNFKYPHDFAVTGNVYQKMMDRNITSPVVQTIQQTNGVQTMKATNNYYDWFGDSKVLLPKTIDIQVAGNAAETRVLFNQYDTYGSILDQQKSSDARASYIWDYNSMYPVAKITNAAYNTVAYTSFEADGNGGWTIPSTTRTAGGYTGSSSYTLSNGNITAAIGNTALKYVVSYWSKNGAAGVNGITALTGPQHNGWTYYEHILPAGTINVTISGTANIDELRLYPTDAQVTTFTYTPLVGMTSLCDAKNLVMYYEYDGQGRLLRVKDQDNNIVKRYDYKYQQLP